MGKDTNIDEGSVIERSVLGKNCKIGKNVKIIESIIWNNVTINNDCVLDHCIVADGAIIGANTHIQPGVVLSQNTEVAANATIPTRTLISSKEGAELPYLVKGKKFEDKDFTLRDEEFLGSTPEYFKQMQQYPEETEEEDEEEDETGNQAYFNITDIDKVSKKTLPIFWKQVLRIKSKSKISQLNLNHLVSEPMLLSQTVSFMLCPLFSSKFKLEMDLLKKL